MTYMTYLMTKDGSRLGNENPLRGILDNRSSGASCCLHEAVPLEKLGISGYSLALTFN